MPVVLHRMVYIQRPLFEKMSALNEKKNIASSESKRFPFGEEPFSEAFSPLKVYQFPFRALLRTSIVGLQT